jgi:hypothetical protein
VIATSPNQGSAGAKAVSVAAPSRTGYHSPGSAAGPKAGSVAAPSRTGYHSPRSAGVAAADGTPTVGDAVTHAAGGTPVLLGGADPRLLPLLSPLFALEREKNRVRIMSDIEQVLKGLSHEIDFGNFDENCWP